jgi:hypothetical protein
MAGYYNQFSPGKTNPLQDSGLKRPKLGLAIDVEDSIKTGIENN